MNAPLSDAAPYVACATACGIVSFFLLMIRRMQQQFQSRWNKRQQLLQSELGKMRGQVQEIAQRLEDLERPSGIGAPSPNVKGINLNRRTQAMRMFRRGETPSEVAEKLGVPQCHAELLLKIHRIINSHAAGAQN